MARTARALAGISASESREVNDFYVTPPYATQVFLEAERFYGPIDEPACGDGAISKVLVNEGFEVNSSDLIDRGYGETGKDFLQQKERKCDTLICNPPFKLADEFVLHALGLGYRHVAVFARLAWLEGAARHKRLWKDHPPSRVWVFSKRQTLWRGDEIGQSTGGALAFAWFVWVEGQGGTQVGWLN